MTRNAYQVASTSAVPSTRRRIAAKAIRSEMRTRIDASARADEVLRLAVAVGMAAVGRPDRRPRPRRASSRAATRSVPECAASESRPRLPVARPVTSLSAMRTTAAATETRAIRRWGLTAYRLTLAAGADSSRHRRAFTVDCPHCGRSSRPPARRDRAEPRLQVPALPPLRRVRTGGRADHVEPSG